MNFRILLSILLISIIGNTVHAQIDFPEIENWKKSEEAKLYNTETLWEYINGAADYYLNYGFEKLEVVEYSLSEDEYIKAEIYSHNSGLNAFGIYAYERPSNADFFDLGSQAYMQHSALNLYGDNYYVKIHSNQTDENTIATIKDIAQKIVQNNIKEEAKNILFNVFPEKNKLLNSEKYYPSNYLGYDFFSNALEVSYKSGDDKFKLFVITGKDNAAILWMLTEYFAFVKHEATFEENTVYEVNDMFNDLVVLTYKENKLFGVFDTDNKKTAKAYLKSLKE